MRAARFHGPNRPLVIEDVPEPVPGLGEVMVRVEAAGVCGTELHFLDGLLTPATAPITLGHEVAGTVAAIGPAAGRGTPVAVGERVAVHYFHPCRHCLPCRTGAEHLCDAPAGFLAFATDGGFAEYVRVPASAVTPLPEGLDARDAAPLCCSATTAIHARGVAALAPGQWAVVYGAGGVGLALVQVLALAGVRTIAVSRTPAKLTLAGDLGAEATVDATAGREAVAEAVLGVTRGRGADAVFETVATRETMATSLALLGKRGALVLVGYGFDPLELSPLALVVPEARVLTSVGNTYPELLEALDLAARGRLRPVVDRVVALDEVNTVLDDLRAGRVEGRAVLVP